MREAAQSGRNEKKRESFRHVDAALRAGKIAKRPAEYPVLADLRLTLWAGPEKLPPLCVFSILAKINRNRALAWLERRLFADQEIPPFDALEMLAKVDRARAIALARDAAERALKEIIGQSVFNLAEASALMGLIKRCKSTLPQGRL